MFICFSKVRFILVLKIKKYFKHFHTKDSLTTINNYTKQNTLIMTCKPLY